jgi:multidrug transporter EmrE-like cation transporter
MIFIICAILFHVCASVLLKYGAINMESYSLPYIVTNYSYIASIIFLFLQALSWQFALKKYDLHQAYIFMGLYYPLILIASYFLFDEKLTTGNLAGVILIIGGLSIRQGTYGK